MRITEDVLLDMVITLRNRTKQNYAIRCHNDFVGLTINDKDSFWQSELMRKRELYYYLCGMFRVLGSE